MEINMPGARIRNKENHFVSGYEKMKINMSVQGVK